MSVDKIAEILYEKYKLSGMSHDEIAEIVSEQVGDLICIPKEMMNLKFGDVIKCDLEHDCYYEASELEYFKAMYKHPQYNYQICDKCYEYRTDIDDIVNAIRNIKGYNPPSKPPTLPPRPEPKMLSTTHWDPKVVDISEIKIPKI